VELSRSRHFDHLASLQIEVVPKIGGQLNPLKKIFGGELCGGFHD